ncbi:unnamed protein product [Didymodactylos carnosus]|uniref:Glycosyl hydrolase family 13 catalytic domain-containing protein n=1 Tax=Didymodactylos carnosus TaxID=1234261 RepID=A0A815H957_9BILA|nr:unnamed protein product [Didymodactylos carnosus]CAF4217480.1 unnamed protein product [Didymodactylos carnosus]
MPSSIEFKLFAPNVSKQISLIGSFSAWNKVSMTKHDDGYFHVNVDLDDGEYEYKYRIEDGEQDIIDPYATRVDIKRQVSLIRIQNGKRIVDTYEWKYDDSKELPVENRDLVIYEVFVADFTEEGTFQSAINKLDYLSTLGINCIQLMPVFEADEGHDWGYVTRHFFSVQSSYGRSEDLKQFVDECHQRGMRVMIDCVFNHSHGECPLTKIDRGFWYYTGLHHPDHPNEVWGPEFNYEHEENGIKPAWLFISDVIRFYIQEYHIDGIRFDATKQIDNHDVLRHFDRLSKELKQNFYTVAEYVPATSKMCKPNGPLDGVWVGVGPNIVEQFSNVNQLEAEKMKSMIDPRYDGKESYEKITNCVTFWACHDNYRLIHWLADKLKYFDRQAFNRLKFAAVILLTCWGVPMIFMGDEFGESKKKEETKTVLKLDWSLPNNRPNHSLLDLYCCLIGFRKSSNALKSDNLSFFYEHIDNQILAYVRWTNEGERVVVVLNFSSINCYRKYRIEHWPQAGKWLDLIDGFTIDVSEQGPEIDLNELKAKVFVWKG